ncbi:hypothetical protein ACA910_010750 [Epithemia clementina (nom. ined.)]
MRFSSAPEQMLHNFMASLNTSATMMVKIPSSRRDQDEVRVNVSTDSAIADNQTQAFFGACLMFKDDNFLLREWIAYHYTVLPLRYLVLGIDVGNREDPAVVLQPWKDFGFLEFRIMNASEFVDKYLTTAGLAIDANRGRNASVLDTANIAHHQFANRQKGFVRKCTQTMKQNELWSRPVTWTTYIDSDEFITWNTWDESEEEDLQKLLLRQRGDSIDVQERNFIQNRKRYLPRFNKDSHGVAATKAKQMTIFDFMVQNDNRIMINNENNNRTACYTLPRLRFGALRNHSCGGDSWPPFTLYDGNILDVHSLSTLQFVQHARKSDFSVNKFGKVMMDVSQLSSTATAINAKPPRNIHRPWLEYCGPSAKPLWRSMLRLNHYLGSWERYSSRNEDARRSKAYWEQTAFLNGGQACQDSTLHWLTWFIDKVGHDRAKVLLNFNDSSLV